MHRKVTRARSRATSLARPYPYRPSAQVRVASGKVADLRRSHQPPFSAPISLTAHNTSRESVPAEATIPDAIRLRRGSARPKKGITFTPNPGVNDVNERPRRRRLVQRPGLDL